LYAAVLIERLRKETKEKRVPESQAGFRKARGTMDNIYISCNIIGKEMRKREESFSISSWISKQLSIK